MIRLVSAICSGYARAAVFSPVVEVRRYSVVFLRVQALPFQVVVRDQAVAVVPVVARVVELERRHAPVAGVRVPVPRLASLLPILSLRLQDA